MRYRLYQRVSWKNGLEAYTAGAKVPVSLRESFSANLAGVFTE